MPRVAAAIAPHGFPVILKPGDDVEGGGETPGQLRAIGDLLRTLQQGPPFTREPRSYETPTACGVIEATRGIDHG